MGHCGTMRSWRLETPKFGFLDPKNPYRPKKLSIIGRKPEGSKGIFPQGAMALWNHGMVMATWDPEIRDQDHRKPMYSENQHEKCILSAQSPNGAKGGCHGTMGPWNRNGELVPRNS